MKNDVSIDYTYYIRSQKSIAQKSLTESKQPKNFVFGTYPTHLLSGNGCQVTDTQKRTYIDYTSADGTNLIGYGDQKIVGAAMFAALNGNNLPLGSVDEIHFAEELKGIIPFIDRVKLFKSGTEAIGHSISLAKCFHPFDEKRRIVLSTRPCNLILEQKLDHFDQLNNPKVAAVIIEPVELNHLDDRKLYLNSLREICTQKGIVLIFNENITAFRFPKYCVSNYYGIIPDLIILGRALGNGFPLYVIGGKKEIMEGHPSFIGSTFSGERSAIAAAREVIKTLKTKLKIEDLWDNGRRFIESFNHLNPSMIKLEGYPSRAVFSGNPLTKALFFQECARAGLLFGSDWFYSFPHIEHLSNNLNIISDVMRKIKSGNATLEGDLPNERTGI